MSRSQVDTSWTPPFPPKAVKLEVQRHKNTQTVVVDSWVSFSFSFSLPCSFSFSFSSLFSFSFLIRRDKTSPSDVVAVDDDLKEGSVREIVSSVEVAFFGEDDRFCCCRLEKLLLSCGRL